MIHFLTRHNCTYIHLFFELMEEFSIGCLRRDAGGTLCRQNGSSDVFQTLLQ